jgi:hypothetical protein
LIFDFVDVQATYSRDALAKAIYARLFDYIIRRVNEVLGYVDDPSLIIMGILDIYGFEIFDVCLISFNCLSDMLLCVLLFSLLDFDIINHQSSIINHQSSIINHQSSIINHQSSIINHQSSIINHQSSLINHQSSIINHQSSLINHSSFLTCHSFIVYLYVFRKMVSNNFVSIMSMRNCNRFSSISHSKKNKKSTNVRTSNGNPSNFSTIKFVVISLNRNKYEIVSLLFSSFEIKSFFFVFDLSHSYFVESDRSFDTSR